MPASHTNILIQPGSPVAISNGSVAACRVYVSSGAVNIQATLANVAPASQDGALPLSAGECLLADIELDKLFPGVGPGPYFLWAWGVGNSNISVSHA